MKKIKRIVSILVVFAIITSNLLNVNYVEADTNNATIESTVDTRVDSPENIRIDLGVQTIVSDGVYSFGNAVVTGEDIRSIIVGFTSQAESGDGISVPTVQGINLVNGTAEYKMISVDEGVDTETVQEYIRDITVTIGGSNKDVQVIISKDTVDRNTYYNYSNRHFYQYVSTGATWTDAYTEANSMSFAGRDGYLATLTSEAEETFVMGINGNTGWVGGTRLPMKTNGNFDTSKERLPSSQYAARGSNCWYWACGPEKDTVYFKTAACNYKSYYSYTGWFSDFNFCCDHMNVLIDTYCTTNAYFNWRCADDQEYCEPSISASGEIGSCMVVQNFGESFMHEIGSSWKAVKYNSSYGYYVEYGDKTVGDSYENCVNAQTVNIRKMSYESKPYIGIDYTNEVLTGFSKDKVYQVNGQILTNISDNGTIPIKEEWFNNDVVVVVKGDGSFTADSSAFVVEVPVRPAAPTGVYGYNRSLTGVNTGMEYRLKGSDEWIKITSTKIQRLLPGIYELRVSASNSSFVSDVSEVEVFLSGADITINVNKKVDVALALGTTGVDYSNFETDLRNYIMSHPEYSSIKQEDLNIMATNAVDTNGKNEFEWLQFDHSDSSSYYNSSNYPFVEYIGTQNANGYNSKDTHIEQQLSGTQLIFYGYGSSAYSDFMILENDQETKKSFQFALKEYFAADALYGTGFFFNCNMNLQGEANKEIAYSKQKLLMSGYLAVIEYNGSAATGLNVYEFKNLNLYTFHHNNGGNSSVISALQAASSSVKALTNIAGSFQIKSTDDLRKFRIDVTPSTVKIYYAGFDDSKHAVSSVKTESEASKFDETSEGYVNFTNQKYDELPLVYQASLPDRFGGSDFGPMTKYGSHNCDSITKVEMSELSMTMDVVRSLSETLREPKWNDNTDKFLINLNEDPINDFDNVAVTAELLNRLQNDDIYYIGWCSDYNANKSQNFLNKNNLKGGIININGVNFDTYDEQIAEIARLIYTRYYGSSAITDVIITDAEKQVSITNADKYNTADVDFPEGKWRIDYYDDFAANNIVYSQTMSDFFCDFDEVGVYKVYYAYMDGDQPIKTITVHSKPEASITSIINKDNKTVGLTADVYDADGNDGEEHKYSWSYKDLGSADNLIAEPETVNIGTAKTALIENLVDGHMYIITLVVEDKFEEKVTISKQISYSEDTPQVLIPPTAFFTLTDSKIITNGNDITVGIIDKSYDPAGDEITYKTVVLYDAAGNKLSDITLDSNDEFVIDAEMTTGNYAIGLTVTSTNGTSNEIKRFFSVINDSTAPVGTPDMSVGNIPLDDNDILISFTDEGSGFKRYRYCVTTNIETPSNDKYGQWSQVPVLNLEFPKSNGIYYIHYQVEDYAENVSYGYFGGYNRTQYLNTPTKLVWEEQNTPVLVWTGDARIDGTNKAGYTVTIYKDGKFFAEINGLTENTYTAANIVRGGDGVYTYTVRAISDGNPLGMGTVEYFDSDVSAMSPELDYIRPEKAVVNGGKLDLSTPINQEKLDEVFNGFAELVSTEPIVIKINNDIILEESIEIDEDVTIDLGGHTVKGPNGDSEGESGAPAIKVTKDNINIDLTGEGSVLGGDGAEGPNGGNGGSAVDFSDTNDGNLFIDKNIDVIGGNGGNGEDGTGGNGGNGVNGNNVNIISKGNTVGGNGGNGVTVGGNGGNGIDNGTGDCVLTGGASVSGGNGGNGNNGGNGGYGINSTGGYIDINDGVSVGGGNGGNGTGNINGNGGNGGAAVKATETNIDNKGMANGGNGGNSTNGNGGNGGAAFDIINGSVNDYSGKVTSGYGGNGVLPGLIGVQRQESNTVPGGVLNGPIEIEDQMTEQEMINAVEQTQAAVDAVFGKNNAYYNPITNTIILLNDVKVENPVVISKDINIDLNGFTFSGADGTEDNPDGKTAIVVDGNDVDIEISNSKSEDGGKLKGGDGYNGMLPGESIGESGGDGGVAIDFSNSSNSSVTVKENTIVSGGNGGNSNSGQAGNGGNAIEGDKVDSLIEGTVIGGNGGHGGLAGGYGGDGLSVGAGNVVIENGTAIGGNGGSGDIGGNGGNAVAVNGDGSDTSGNVNINGGNSNVTGGNAGVSFNGTEGEVGKAVENVNGNVEVTSDLNGAPTINEGYDVDGNRTETTDENLEGIETSNGGEIITPVTQENLDEVFGEGNAEYDPQTNTIIVKDDLYMEDSIVINGDITIDLAGNDIYGADGTETEIDAPPVILVKSDDVQIDIIDSVGGGSINGGKGCNTSDSVAGKGGNVVDFSNTTGGNITVDNAELVGGHGGDSASNNGGKGGTAIAGNDILVKNNGSLIGGDGGYSSIGNGGHGGAAISGDDSVIDSLGNSISGNGGNSGRGNGGNGGTVFEGNNQQVNISGIVSAGEEGDSIKESGASGLPGNVSDNTGSVSYETVLDNEYFGFVPNGDITPGTEFSGTITHKPEYSDNEFVKYPDSIKVVVNGEVLDPSEYLYNKETGEVVIPADKVKGSIDIEPDVIIPDSIDVTNEDELRDALDLGIEEVVVTEDIVLTDDITVKEETKLVIEKDASLDLGDNSMNVDGSLDAKGEIICDDNGGVIPGDGSVVKYTPVLPENKIGYTVELPEGVSDTVNHGESFTFIVNIHDGYSATDNFKVYVNDVEVSLCSDSSYTIDSVEGQLVITVEGVADVTAPNGTISVYEHKWENEFITPIIFNEFFIKPVHKVTIFAEDSGSGVKKISYFVTDIELTLSDVEMIPEALWNEYTESFEVVQNDTGLIVYARVDDNDNNIRYISSNGLSFIVEKPVIEGTDNYEIYDDEHTLVVDPVTTKEVIINGVVTPFDSEGKIHLTESGVYNIVVTDKVGSTAAYDIRILGEDEVNGIIEEKVEDEVIYIYDVGSISIEIVEGNEELTEMVLANSKNVIEAVLEEVDYDRASKGSNIKIRVSFNESMAEIDTSDVEIIKAVVSDSSIEEFEVLKYIDITVEYAIDDGEWKKVSVAKDEIEFTITLPEKYLDNVEKLYMIRCHDGMAEILSDLDINDDTITVKSALYSTYAIAKEPAVTSYEKAANDWKTANDDILNIDKISSDNVENIIKAMEDYNKLPEKAKELLKDEDVIDIIEVFEFVVKYADVITKPDVTKDDLEELEEAIKSLSNFTDDMKQLIDTDLIEELEDKKDSAQKQADASGDIDAGDNNITGILTVMFCAFSLGVIVCITGKRKRIHNIIK